MSENAVEYAKQYAWEDVTEKMVAVYEGVMKKIRANKLVFRGFGQILPPGACSLFEVVVLARNYDALSEFK